MLSVVETSVQWPHSHTGGDQLVTGADYYDSGTTPAPIVVDRQSSEPELTPTVTTVTFINNNKLCASVQ